MQYYILLSLIFYISFNFLYTLPPTNIVHTYCALLSLLFQEPSVLPSSRFQLDFNIQSLTLIRKLEWVDEAFSSFFSSLQIMRLVSRNCQISVWCPLLVLPQYWSQHATAWAAAV